MKCLIGGCRGGNPVTESKFSRYGFDTTSFLIEGEAGEQLIIDAGTGIRGITEHLKRRSVEQTGSSVCLLFTHAHLDHLMGFPSFRLLYDPQWSIHIAMAMRPDIPDLESAIGNWMKPPWWPVTLEMMPAHKQFTMLDPDSGDAPLILGGLEIRWCPQQHPGGSTAFRIDESVTGKSIVIATDVEWAESSPEGQQALRRLCAEPTGATVLIFDGKCAPDEYPTVRGFGHSTWQEGIDLAQSCHVQKLIITHHGPDMTDEQGDARNELIQSVWPQALLARQGMYWTV